jgi:hypothetical protein
MEHRRSSSISAVIEAIERALDQGEQRFNDDL